MKLLTWSLICLPFCIKAQEQSSTGIQFESGLSWLQIQSKARAENKFIFVDCYATWCGPCKLMEKNIYPQKEVGDYFNSHFVNVKVQMDKTPKDNQNIKDWYADATSIARQYNINAYPTFLFFSPEGEAVHEISGASRIGAEFISKASNALVPDKQYFTLFHNWNYHKQDSAYLIKTIFASSEAGDNEQVGAILNDYIICLKSPLSNETINLVGEFTRAESDMGFALYLQNAPQIDALMKRDGFAEQTLADIIFKEEIAPLFLNRNKEASFNWKNIRGKVSKKYSQLNGQKLSERFDQRFQTDVIEKEIHSEINDNVIMHVDDWAKISQRLEKRFRGYDHESSLLYVETLYYYSKQLWEECAHACIFYIDHVYSKMSPGGINDMIWRCIFLHSQNNKFLARAIGYMEGILNRTPNDELDLDTYANLLYKIGRKQEGIKWEKKAISISDANGNSDNELRNTLQKMQKGEPTWSESAKN